MFPQGSSIQHRVQSEKESSRKGLGLFVVSKQPLMIGAHLLDHLSTSQRHCLNLSHPPAYHKRGANNRGVEAAGVRLLGCATSSRHSQWIDSPLFFCLPLDFGCR